ncbi:hypothetical protein D9M73_112010 [compost metagenome]
MRPGKLLGQIRQIGREIRRNRQFGIFRAAGIDILDPRLMRHLQATTKRDGQQRQPIGHHLAQHTRALAAAGDEHAKNAVFLQQRIGLGTQRQHRIAHRVADQMRLRAQLGGQSRDVFVRGGDRIHLVRDQPVDATEHGILLMHRRRDALIERRQERRQRRIATKTDHCIRPEALVELDRHRAALQHCRRRLDIADRPAAQPPGGQDMRLNALEQAGKAHPALIADQCDIMPALDQFRRQCCRRDHMPASAARRQNEMPCRAHTPLRCPLPRWAMYFDRVTKGLRRVNASSKPIPIDKAISEDPP